MKNLNVEQRKIVKEYITPEFTTSSKKTAIGYEYWQDKKSTIIRNNGIMIKINEKIKNKKIPKYYMKIWEKTNKNEIERYKNHTKINGLKRWKEQLSKTSLSESNYKKQMEDSLKIKTKILSRNNQI